MLKEQRQAFIRDEIKKNGFASVDNLVAQMDSSYSTVRRDIDELAEMGVLVRVHGGAVATATTNTSYEPPFNVRQDLFEEEKQRIAKAAHDLIQPNETLLYCHQRHDERHGAGKKIQCGSNGSGRQSSQAPLLPEWIFYGKHDPTDPRG